MSFKHTINLPNFKDLKRRAIAIAEEAVFSSEVRTLLSELAVTPQGKRLCELGVDLNDLQLTPQFESDSTGT